MARSLEDLLSDQSMAFFVIDSRNFSHAVFTSVGASHDQPRLGRAHRRVLSFIREGCCGICGRIGHCAVQ